LKIDKKKVIKIEDTNYISNKLGETKEIVLDNSSPKIAKSFSIIYFHSTAIDNSLKRF
jgi:arginyl-tRNA synthetase